MQITAVIKPEQTLSGDSGKKNFKTLPDIFFSTHSSHSRLLIKRDRKTPSRP
ncbi:MAG: hypothetical protein LUG51_09155 [Tannerellaceae bacterium]|nr:hypothetical protein [Tannerellaceae bacterium]